MSENDLSLASLLPGLSAGADAYGPTLSPAMGPDTDVNADADTDRVCVLAEFGLISAIGPQAREFLNGQLTNDVLKLGQDAVQLDGYCSPKGRLLASFIEWPVADGIHLAVAADLAAPIARRLSMFVLRAKLKITDESPRHVAIGVQGARLAESLGKLGMPLPAVWTLARGSGLTVLCLPGPTDDRPRAMVWMPREAVNGTLSRLGLPIVPSEGWRDADIRAGLPRIVSASSELFVPQMVNFDLIGAVNFKKGCYPGQEVVARSQYLGKLKRRMFLVRAQVMGAPGDDVFSADSKEPVGKVVMAARQSGSQDIAMLVELQTSAASAGGLLVNDGAVSLETLPYEVPLGA